MRSPGEITFVIGPKPMKFADLAYDDTYVAEVLFPIRSGKEATVFCCQAQPHTGLSLVAAKVYRPIESRMFRNDALYQQGRHINDARMWRAYRNKSRTGRRIQYSGWVSSEYETMCILHDSGAAVPEPYTQTQSTIIMEYIGDPDQPAPMLNQVH
jgi:RIO kinase 1